VPEQPEKAQPDVPQPALCGFRRCRAPLPPPGPRGGRPFEFCPDRLWPGDKTCKQLAAAEQALREALGSTGTPTALQDASDAFVQASSQVTGPLQALSNALDTITARLQEEVSAAVAQARDAESRAVDAEQRREIAQARASQAEQAQEDAQEEAGQARQARELAQARAGEAIAARAEAELHRARAEAVAEATATQAEKSAAEAKAERARADTVTTELGRRTEALAVRTAERDAARNALTDLRDHSRDLERALTEQNTQLAAELDQVHTRLREAEHQRHVLTQQHQDAAAAHGERVSSLRTHVARLEGQLETVKQNVEHLTGRSDELDHLLSRVHRLVLDTAGSPDGLRDRLLSELLDRGPTHTTPKAAAQLHTDTT
jgi:chromosome segregation ATPase